MWKDVRTNRTATLLTGVLILMGGVSAINMYRTAHASSDGAIPYQGQNEGRYQLFYSPNVRADTFLLDTASGSVWQLVKAKDNNSLFQPVFWVRNPVKTLVPGRYKIYYSSSIRADTFILDTQTGIIAMLSLGKDNVVTFEKLPVEGINGAAYQ